MANPCVLKALFGGSCGAPTVSRESPNKLEVRFFAAPGQYEVYSLELLRDGGLQDGGLLVGTDGDGVLLFGADSVQQAMAGQRVQENGTLAAGDCSGPT